MHGSTRASDHRAAGGLPSAADFGHQPQIRVHAAGEPEGCREVLKREWDGGNLGPGGFGRLPATASGWPPPTPMLFTLAPPGAQDCPGSVGRGRGVVSAPAGSAEIPVSPLRHLPLRDRTSPRDVTPERLTGRPAAWLAGNGHGNDHSNGKVSPADPDSAGSPKWRANGPCPEDRPTRSPENPDQQPDSNSQNRLRFRAHHSEPAECEEHIGGRAPIVVITLSFAKESS